MILIGQYDSPFVRRVGIALTLYGLSFEHRPWSVFGDADRLRPLNPLVRVPTLVLEDGATLIDSASILDHLDDEVGSERALIARSGAARRDALRVMTLATGLADLAVSLFYEIRMHATASPALVARRESQLASALAALEADRGPRTGRYWVGDRISHADIAVACALRFISEAHPHLAARQACPTAFDHADRLESEPVFRQISQPFIPPS